MDFSVVKASEEKYRCQIGCLGVRHDRLGGWPSSEMTANSCDLIDVARKMVEWQEKGSDFASNISNMIGVGVCGSDRKIEITVGSPVRIMLCCLERTCVSDPAVQAKWHNPDHAETGCDGCFCHV